MKILIVISFLLLSNSANTQIVVSNEIFRNLYLGIDNPISPSLLHLPENKVVLKSDDGIIRKASKNKYFWKICSTDKKLVYLKVYNQNKLTDSIAFKVLALPDPFIRTCNQDNELMFKICQGVRGDIVDFVMEGIPCKIKKFTITIVKNPNAIITIENIGAYYEIAAKMAFEELKIGETVTLSNFVVTVGCEKSPRQLTNVLSSVYSGNAYEFRH
jgi:hypothetical protein